MGLYIYDGHLGRFYTSEYPIPDDLLYCEVCGDYDWELGFAENRAEAKGILQSQDSYSDETIEDFLNEEFPE